MITEDQLAGLANALKQAYLEGLRSTRNWEDSETKFYLDLKKAELEASNELA